jgi:hypothetical protein
LHSSKSRKAAFLPKGVGNPAIKGAGVDVSMQLLDTL